MASGRSALALIHVAAAAAMLLAVVAVGGRPSAFPDTAFYYSQGEYAALRLGLIGPADTLAGMKDPTSAVANATAAAPTVLDGVFGARPPAYGLLLYGAARAGGLWAMAAVQALLAAALLWTATRAVLGRRGLRAFYGLVTGMALVSALPFVAGLAMPDIFAGLSGLAAGLLLFYPDRMSRAELACSGLLLMFGVACHPTHPLIVALALPLGLTLAWKGRASRMGVLSVTVCLLAGVALSVGLKALATPPGHTLSSPPFVTARVLADGPGRPYLRQACKGGVRYALCAWRGQPLDNAEAVLWSSEAADGVYALADPATRAALQREQARFALAAVAAHPLEEAAAAARNTARQLVSFSVDDELRNDADFWRQPVLSHTRLTRILPDMGPCLHSRSACANRFPYRPVRALQQSVVILAIGWLGWRMARACRPRSRPADPTGDEGRLARLVLWLSAVVVANALACGALSGPFPRYGARVIWLIPMSAGLWLMQDTLRRRPIGPGVAGTA